MSLMLPASILKNNDVRYNDDLKYISGDNIYEPEKPKNNVVSEEDKETYINDWLENYVKNNHPSFKYYETEYIPGNVEEMASIFEEKECVFSKSSLNEIKHIGWSSAPKYNYLRYNGYTDTLIIPEIYKNDLDSGKEINATIHIYNSDRTDKQHYFLKNCKCISRVNPTLEYIPNVLKCSKFSEEYGKFIDGYIYILYKNMPLSVLNNVNTFFYDYSIDVNTNDKIFEFSNMTKFNVLCYDIAKYGIQNEILLRLYDDGTLIPINCSQYIIAAKLLNIPYIPVCIVKSYHTLPDIYNYKQINVDKDVIKTFLQPQILLKD